jgi:hypothetical protein
MRLPKFVHQETLTIMDNIELGQRYRPSRRPKPGGYAKWASWIASDPDNEPFVFRKFNELGALNLLYLQSEMIFLEAQLKELDLEELKHHDIDSINATRQWEALLEQCAQCELTENMRPGNTDSIAFIKAKNKMELILRLRAKMKEYCEFRPQSFL